MRKMDYRAHLLHYMGEAPRLAAVSCGVFFQFTVLVTGEGGRSKG
jgi:hypothetical protein